MKIPYYQVNAFTGKGFKGNSAGVCLLNGQIDESVMRKVAYENKLSETAFVVNNKSDFDIRWFAPKTEVDICGHATLASGLVLMKLIDKTLKKVTFNSRSGVLSVHRKDESFVMDFPSDVISETEIAPIFKEAFHKNPAQAFIGKTDYMLVFQNENEIRQMIPRIDLLETINVRGIIVTATGDTVDFVSWFFAPQSGIPEYPVTGSAHTTLVPY